MHKVSEDAAALLGKQVVVTLGKENGSPVIAEGQLLSFDEWGEVRLRDEMGGVHYCWPMLIIRAKEEVSD